MQLRRLALTMLPRIRYALALTMLPLTAAQESILRSKVAALEDAPRYRGGFTSDDDGIGHAWGAVDTARYGSCCGTLEDVRSLRVALKRADLILTSDQTDGLLAEALYLGSRAPYNVIAMDKKRTRPMREKARRTMQRRRERLRAAGLCIACGTNPVSGTVTCADCGKRANAHRAAKKAS